MATKYPAPAGLGERAELLWHDITERWDLRVDELIVLESACREVDLIDRMAAHQESADLITVGSQKQLVAGPMLGELRAHRALLAAHMKQLNLPDEDGRKANKVSETQRANANARWKRAG